MAPDEAAQTAPASMALSPQEAAAVEVAAQVLGAADQPPTDADGVTLVYPDGRQAALQEATLGDREDLRLARLRRQADMQWPAPARWWWQVVINDVTGLPRLRELFPVVARACEANDVPDPGWLPAALTEVLPDLHWLVHTVPAQLIGHPGVLDRPATVTLGRGHPVDREMTTVVRALDDWMTSDAAVRALNRLSTRRMDERQLYLTVGCTGLAAEAFDALVRGSGLPPAPPPTRPAFSHLWLAPVLGRTVFLWSREHGWSRHEPYGRPGGLGPVVGDARRES